MSKGRILLVDDEAQIRKILKLVLEGEDYIVDTAKNGQEAFKLLEKRNYDILLSDLKMPKMNGLELMRKISEGNFNITVVFITAYAEIKDAVEAIKLGAFDYIEKTFTTDELLDTIARALMHQKMLNKNLSLKKQLTHHSSFNGIIGESQKIKEIISLINNIAESKVTVLITGESGTGKELFAQAIHKSSSRRDKPFVAINCAAIPENLLESELFGYEKGAFTGAFAQKKGKFELASGGTVFLDEIGDISLSLQAKLLRVLQEKEYERVGGLETIRTDMRVLAATNKCLEEAINNGTFREDLFYRLNVVNIAIPPLRERMKDIPLLAEFFLKECCKEYSKEVKLISLEAVDCLCAYDWKGNARELKNVIERAVAIMNPAQKVLEPRHLPPRIIGIKKDEKEQGMQEGISLSDMEKQYILNILKRVNWNKTKAAEILKINRQTLYNKIKELNIEKHFKNRLRK